MKVIELHKSVTDSNDRDAQKLREELKEKGVFFINLMSAAGSGKTTLLLKTIEDLNTGSLFWKRILKRMSMPSRSKTPVPDPFRSTLTACVTWMPE